MKIDPSEIIAKNENLAQITRNFMKAIEDFNESAGKEITQVRAAYRSNGLEGETADAIAASIEEQVKDIEKNINELNRLHADLDGKAVLYDKMIALMKKVAE